MKAAFVFKFRLKITRCAEGNMKTNSLLIFPWEQARAYALSLTSTQPAAVVLSLGLQHHQDRVAQGARLRIWQCGRHIQIWQGSKNSSQLGTDG